MQIVYEDAHLLAISKPAGLLSVPGKHPDNYDSVQSRLSTEYPGVNAIHRLDMATSGLILFAKHKDAERYYKRQFEQRLVVKEYVALARGLIKNKMGSINLPLRVDWPNRPMQRVNYALGKEALTYFECLDFDYANNYTRVKLYPHTGRSHQLRVHMASIGHPLLGDKLYYKDKASQFDRLYLHAEKIEIQSYENTSLNIFQQANF